MHPARRAETRRTVKAAGSGNERAWSIFDIVATRGKESVRHPSPDPSGAESGPPSSSDHSEGGVTKSLNIT